MASNPEILRFAQDDGIGVTTQMKNDAFKESG
jgi:hypothetical protein